MQDDSRGRQPLIPAAEIETVERRTSAADAADGDPFIAFTEWSEPADEAAWRDL